MRGHQDGSHTKQSRIHFSFNVFRVWRPPLYSTLRELPSFSGLSHLELCSTPEGLSSLIHQTNYKASSFLNLLWTLWREAVGKLDFAHQIMIEQGSILRAYRQSSGRPRRDYINCILSQWRNDC